MYLVPQFTLSLRVGFWETQLVSCKTELAANKKSNPNPTAVWIIQCCRSHFGVLFWLTWTFLSQHNRQQHKPRFLFTLVFGIELTIVFDIFQRRWSPAEMIDDGNGNYDGIHCSNNEGKCMDVARDWPLRKQLTLAEGVPPDLLVRIISPLHFFFVLVLVSLVLLTSIFCLFHARDLLLSTPAAVWYDFIQYIYESKSICISCIRYSSNDYDDYYNNDIPSTELYYHESWSWNECKWSEWRRYD